MKDILEFYKEGGEKGMYPSRREQYKKDYENWSKLLEHYYFKKNMKMSGYYLREHMKDSNVKDIPSARFTDAWLSRSVYKQLFRPLRKPKPISSMIAYKVNQLVQADTVFVLRKAAAKIDSMFMLPEAKQQLALEGLKAGESTAMVTMIDTLSRRGYAWPVQRPGSALETRKILKKMFLQAEAWATSKGFKNAEISRIQTDNGSEFLGKNDPNRTQRWLSDNGYRQSFSFEGKSAAQGMVESFNKTLKYILRSLVKYNNDGTINWNGWTDHLSTALRIYNSKYHSTIGTAPNKISSNPENKHYYKHVIERLKERRNAAKPFTQSSLAVGDYVRVIAYNASKDKNKGQWTFKGGDLHTFAASNPKKYGPADIWHGLYRIHAVRPELAGRALTFSVMGRWYTEFSGSRGQPFRKIKEGVFKGEVYPDRATVRHFTSEELQRMPVETRGGLKYPNLILDVRRTKLTENTKEKTGPILRPRKKKPMSPQKIYNTRSSKKKKS